MFGILLAEFDIRTKFWLGLLISANLLAIPGMRKGSWKRINFFIPSLFIIAGTLLHGKQAETTVRRSQDNSFLTEIISEPKIKTDHISVEAELLVYDSAFESFQAANQKIQLIIKEDASAENLLPGDLLLINGSIRPIKSAPNPSSFDYGAYMGRKGIYAQAWIDSGSWTKLTEHSGIKRFAVQCRNTILDRIDRHITSQENRAILKALLTGYNQELVPEIREVYAKSGTMHMLAVSGMHVGILLLLLSSSLSWLLNRAIKNALLILLLWLFALFTGLSPSVMRAASMCSLYLLAEALQREHKTWNALAFALIVLLVWDANMLFNAGFQLSFLALSGILLIQKSPSKAKTWKQKVKYWLMAYLKVSIAAQLATAPIALFYFHQFPLYFLLGNLLIVPLAAPLMYGGIFLLLFSELSWLANPIAWLLDLLLSLTHWLASQLSNLPYAAIPVESMQSASVLLLYALLICLVLRSKLKRNRPVLVGIGLLCIFILWQGIEDLNRTKQSGLIIYSSAIGTPMDYYRGTQVSMIHAEDSTLRESRKVFYTQHQLEVCDTLNLVTHSWGYSLLIDSTRILFYQSNTPCLFPKSTLQTLLVLEKEAQGDLTVLLDSLNFCNIVLAKNLSWKARKHWMEQADSLGVSLYDIHSEGAFKLDYGSTR